MAIFTIDGQTYQGNDIRVVNGAVYIDGKLQNGDQLNGVVEIRVLEGEIRELTTDASVNCGKVNGNVSAGGSVRCEDIGGNVNAGGSVRCDEISGNVNAGGSVRHG